MKKIIITLGLIFIFQPSVAQIFVDSNAAGSNNGTSWADAYIDLQDAIAASNSGDDIWVAEGTYYPDEGAGQSNNDRDATFQLKNGVAIYGGFSGTESTLSERDWSTHITTLSGDINQSGDLTGNAYSVVTGSGANNSAVIDGFSITAGNADETSGPLTRRYGGGMYNNNGSPSVSNTIFSDNYARFGGGIFNYNGSDLIIINCRFTENSAGDGAGLHNFSSSPTITNSNFEGNSADFGGGGMYNDDSSPSITNTFISGNIAGNQGGGMVNDLSSPTITNTIISGNSVDFFGGGITNFSSSSPVITNTILSGNSAGLEGGGIYSDSSSPSITNCILWANGSEIDNNGTTPTVTFSIVQGGYAGTGNLNVDPLFVDAANGDYRLQIGSPAIDAGNNANVPGGITTDLNGLSRITDGDGNGTATVDLGAYELSGCPTGAGNILFVDVTQVASPPDGLTWGTAYSRLQDALDATGKCPNVTQIWVAEGTYYPDEGAVQTNNERNATFQLKNGITIYGGFSGTESTLSERDWSTHITSLSGDINQSGNLTGNAYSVVTGSGTDNSAVIDGFSISSGNANATSGSASDPKRTGGGMYNNAGSPTVSNTIFSGNSAESFGGGIYNNNSSSQIINCSFTGNTSNNGGGLFNDDSSSPTITNCSFTGNTAINNGGGLVNALSSPVITNTFFSGNIVAYDGGGMFNFASSPTITNTIFSGNTAGFEGGGMYNDFSSSPVITNTTFSANSADVEGGGILNDNSSPSITNCIIWNNMVGGSTTSTFASVANINGSTPMLSYNLVANSGGSGNWANAIGTDGGNNIDDDPLFIAPLAPGLSTGGDYRLQPGSPAIDAGLNTANTLPTDLDENPRLVYGIIDMGAYEKQEVCSGSHVLYVASSASGTNDGTSWTNAFNRLQDALKSSCPGITEIWVAEGTYYPDEGGGQTNDNREATFQLQNGVAIYGGFSGNESTLSERDWSTHITSLSGDINQSGNLTGNAYSVVTGSGTDNSAVIDGFSISSGNANATSGSASDPKRTGGGMYNNAGSPTVSNTIFSGNSAEDGAGIYNIIDSDPVIINCRFSGNSADGNGGGMCNSSSSPTIINCSFSGNTANNGGGITNIFSSPFITNSIMWNNMANGSTTSTSASVANLIGSTPMFSYNIVANSGGSGSWASGIGTDNGNNIDADPLFVAPLAPGLSTDGDYRLQFGSPAIDAGNNASVPGGITADLNGLSRITDGDGNGTANVDLGAYELSGCPTGTGNILFVDVTQVASTPDGLTWGTAYSRLQDALEAADNCPNVTQIWVAEGTYYPDEGGGQNNNNRDATFQLKNGVAIYGGFSGTESTLSERDWSTHITTLSGDINQSGNLTGNAYTVVTGSGTDNSAVIDGFTISAGNADDGSSGAALELRGGGGMYNREGSPTVSNTIFSGNSAEDGAGIYNIINSDPVIINCSFTENTAASQGGGIHNSSSASPTITNCSFTGNTASTGGGIFNIFNSPVVITNTIFSGNSAGFNGGGIYSFGTPSVIINCSFTENTANAGGGIYNEFASSSTVITNTIISGNAAVDDGGGIHEDGAPTITNTIISGNSAGNDGGGIYNESSPIITNTIISGNSAGNDGDGIFNSSFSSPTITNCILWNNGSEIYNSFSSSNPTVTFSIVQGGYSGTGNLDADPLFTDAANGDYRLQSGSPAINAGNNAAYQTATGTDPASDTDLNGNARLFQSNIDRGAYEVDFKQSQWRGTLSDDWANNSNWDEDVPDDQTVALIRDISLNTPHISATTQAETSDLVLAENTALHVNGILKVTETIRNDGQIRFNSNDNKTGQFDTFTGTITGTGEITVERYIPAKRAFRLLSSPVTTTDFIYENWQENGSTPATPDGLGTHITGGDVSLGFDQSGSNNPSMFTFDNDTQNWQELENTNATKLTAEVPYLTMVRGDRTIDLTDNGSMPTETTLRATGQLFTGSSSPALNTGSGSYNLIANPYQAMVDYSSASRTGLTDFIYVWDASIGGANGRGGYVTVEVSSNDITDPSPTTSDATKFIAPGMSFFIQNLSGGSIAPALSFSENDKATGENQMTVFNTYPHFYINSRLYISSDLEDGNSERDAIGLRFSDNFTSTGNDEDATKFINPDENYAVVNNGLRSIDKQALPGPGHHINFSITNYTETNYSLTFVLENKPEDLNVFLKDEYLDMQTELSESFVYDFSVDQNIPESTAENRFSLNFMETTLSTNTINPFDDFKLYPNPAEDYVFITASNLSGKAEIEISNMLGQQVITRHKITDKQTIMIDVKNLSTGIYIIKLTDGDKSFSSKFIVK